MRQFIGLGKVKRNSKKEKLFCDNVLVFNIIKMNIFIRDKEIACQAGKSGVSGRKSSRSIRCYSEREPLTPRSTKEIIYDEENLKEHYHRNPYLKLRVDKFIYKYGETKKIKFDLHPHTTKASHPNKELMTFRKYRSEKERPLLETASQAKKKLSLASLYRKS